METKGKPPNSRNIHTRLKEEEILNKSHKKICRTKKEDTLQNLCKRDDIIITNADEGGAIVIVDAHDCVREANQ